MPHDRHSRREFLKLGGLLAAGAGLSGAQGEVLAEGIERLSQGLVRVVWLQAQACSGCSVSLLNADEPTIFQVITERIRLAFHPTISAAQGAQALEIISKIERSSEPFILVVEGAVPGDMPEACRIAGRPLAETLVPLARRAQFVLAAGTCASFGGIPSAEGNATGATGVRELMAKSGVHIERRLVHCPGCPTHPAEFLAVLSHLAAKGYPDVRSDLLVPAMLTTACVHFQCPRLPQFNARMFAMYFGDGDACLYQLGCRGLDVYADCPRHRWNGGVNWCVEASAPCIGCNQPHFAKLRGYGFYNKGEAT